MMTKARSGSLASLKILLALPVVIFLLLLISACEKSINTLKAQPETELPSPADNQTAEIPAASVIRKPVEKADAPPPPPPPLASQENKIEAIQENSVLNAGIPNETFVVVEEMPTFPGGEKALMEFIYNNINYPENAKQKGIQGRVILRFAVMANGSIDNVQVLKGVDSELDQEAKRVISMLPVWKPGRQEGKPVNVWYSVPVTFQIK